MKKNILTFVAFVVLIALFTICWYAIVAFSRYALLGEVELSAVPMWAQLLWCVLALAWSMTLPLCVFSDLCDRFGI